MSTPQQTGAGGDSRPPSTARSTLLSRLGPYDVLLGRGTGPNEKQGNQFFRDVTRKHKWEYQNSASRKEKREIVLRALEEVRSRGGSFVEKVVPLSGNRSQHQQADRFEIVDDTVAFLKARQAFRYVLQGGGGGSSSSSSVQHHEREQERSQHQHIATLRREAEQAIESPVVLRAVNNHVPRARSQSLGSDYQHSDHLSSPLVQRMALSSLNSPLMMAPYSNSSYLAAAAMRAQQSPMSIPQHLLSPPGALTNPLNSSMRPTSSLLQRLEATRPHTTSSSLLLRSPEGLSGRTRISPNMSNQQPLQQSSPFGTRADFSESPLERMLHEANHFRLSSAASRFSEQMMLQQRAAVLLQQEQQHAHQRRQLVAARLMAPNLQALASVHDAASSSTTRRGGEPNAWGTLEAQQLQPSEEKNKTPRHKEKYSNPTAAAAGAASSFSKTETNPQRVAANLRELMGFFPGDQHAVPKSPPAPDP